MTREFILLSGYIENDFGIQIVRIMHTARGKSSYTHERQIFVKSVKRLSNIDI